VPLPAVLQQGATLQAFKEIYRYATLCITILYTESMYKCTCLLQCMQYVRRFVALHTKQRSDVDHLEAASVGTAQLRVLMHEDHLHNCLCTARCFYATYECVAYCHKCITQMRCLILRTFAYAVYTWILQVRRSCAVCCGIHCSKDCCAQAVQARSRSG
jgi:hypothetical protein